MTITDRKTLKMLGDYLRDILASAVSVPGTCGECGGDISAEAKSKFMNGWIRRYRKGLREGGAAGLAYRSERKISCPECGRSVKAAVARDTMFGIMDLIEDCDPLFLRAQAEEGIAKLSAAKKQHSAAAAEMDSVRAQKPYFCVRRPSESLIDIVIGWFDKPRQTRRKKELVLQLQEYDAARAAHDLRKSEWQKTENAAREKEREFAAAVSSAKDDVYAMCKVRGILPLVFPDFIADCERAIGRRIAELSAAEPPSRTAAKRRKRGAAGLSLGPGGVRPWVRVGGVGMSFGKSGVGIFARKGPFALYAKNGKVRIGGRLFRF